MTSPPRKRGDGPLSPEDLALPAPEHTEDELRAARDTARLRAAEVRARADRLRGAMAAGGSEDALSAREAELTAEITRLQGEYDALTLAMDALAEANTDLQNRFSPALGRRAAEIFAQLTDGRYDAVALDRSFRLCSGARGRPRSPGTPSTSPPERWTSCIWPVRLAICELVLPPEKQAPIPLILDDALANFDDSRCAAAIRFLRQEAPRVGRSCSSPATAGRRSSSGTIRPSASNSWADGARRRPWRPAGGAVDRPGVPGKPGSFPPPFSFW